MSGPRQRPVWHAAYDAQMALWRWYRTADGVKWMRGSYRANVSKLPKATREMVLRLYDGEMGRLIDCDPIYVSEGMCDVIDAAREAFAPEPLLETDLLTPRGFLWLARGILTEDRYGHPLMIHGASWARQYTAEKGDAEEAMRRLYSDEHVAEYGDRVRTSEMDAMVAEGLISADGVGITLYADRDHYLNETQASAGYVVPDGAREETAAVPAVPMHLTPWWFNMDFAGNETDVIGEATGARGWWTLFQSALRLMQQRIAHRSIARADRPARREARRLNYPDPEIVVVRLRHEQGDRQEPTGESANYSHRFIVGGHWRNQPYPKEGLHRQIWISPYVKGPEDKPLIVRPRRVFQWTR